MMLPQVYEGLLTVADAFGNPRWSGGDSVTLMVLAEGRPALGGQVQDMGDGSYRQGLEMHAA